MDNHNRRNYDEDENSHELGVGSDIQRMINIGKAVASILLFIASGIVIYFNVILEMKDLRKDQQEQRTVMELEQKYMLKDQTSMSGELRYIKTRIDAHERDIIINTQHRIATDARRRQTKTTTD